MIYSQCNEMERGVNESGQAMMMRAIRLTDGNLQ